LHIAEKLLNTDSREITDGAQESARKAGNVRHGLLKFFRFDVDFRGFSYINDDVYM
jgi:hypothetical protein